MPAKDVVALYSPQEDFTSSSSFWVRITCGTYKNDVSYVLLRNGDKVEMLLAPQERPYDNDHSHKLLFNIETARQSGCAVMVEGTSDTGNITCGRLVYQQGLLC